MEQVLVSHSGALHKRWQKAFPSGVLMSSISSLKTINKDVGRLVWLDVTAISAEKRIAVVQEVIGNNWPVVVMTYNPNDDEAYAMIKSGAYGYCHAMSAVKQLNEITTVIGSGSLWIGAGLMQKMLTLSMTVDVKVDPPATLLSELTPREHMVADQVGHGATNKQIAENLRIAERTVKAHLSTVFEKLQVRDRVQLALVMNNVPIK